MRRALGVLLVSAVLAATRPSGADLVPTAAPHERTAKAGVHPRLLLAPDEVEAVRRKVNAPGTLSSFLWRRALDATSRNAGVPDFWAALHATAPLAAQLAESEEERRAWGRTAVESALAAARAFDPPYPDQEEWWGRYLYRYLALAYDMAYADMTPSERGELQEEMQRIAASIGGTERSPNNHSVVFGIDLGLLAMALDGDVPAVAREIADEPVVRGVPFAGGDWLRFRSGIEVLRVGDRPGTADYAPTKDYVVKWFRDDRSPQQQGFGLVWVAGGRAPAAGATYHVAYRFLPDLPAWKDSARATVQRNLDAVWGDGASLAGVMYGGWTMNWLLDAIESMRRNLGVDFARHPAVRDFVRWLPTELLPTDRPFLRANNRNDSGYDQMDNRVRFGAPLTWASTRFRGDEGGRDLDAAWLLSRSEAWVEWSDGREAMWARDDLLGPPPFARRTGLHAPLSAFFRGHGLSNYRTGAWDGPPDDWALFSLVGGPFVGPEHDQTDKGSFTFYAVGEDFAVDSGYAQGDARSDATAAHNYVLVDGKGQPGPWGTTALVRAHFLGASWDATHVDLRRSWRNANQWGAPKDEKPDLWPVAAADRWGVLLQRAGRAPVAVVADSIDVDGKPHAFEWLLHTQAGNTVAIDGSRATLGGAHGKGRCTVHLAGAAALALRQDTARGVEMPEHPRLVAAVTAPDPAFLALLVPERADERTPLDVRTERGEGWSGATVSGTDGRDVVLFRPGGAPVKALGLETDAALAVVRLGPGGAPTAWLVFRATVLKHGGKTLWQAERPKGVRGSASFDGERLAVEAPDLQQFRAVARGTAFTNGDVTLQGTATADGLAWTGRRPLRDANPAGVPALAEDFESTCAPYFMQWPLARPRMVRCVDGELCLPGLEHDWVSWTRRTWTPFRADLVAWPRTIFQDFVLRGEVTFVEWRPGATWRLQAHVSDRSFPEDWLPPDQDLLQVEVDPARGEASLVRRAGGKDAVLATAKIGAVPKGKKTPFELSVQGPAIRFSLGGTPRLRFTDRADALPSSGYFQWEQMEGIHTHLDDLRVTVDP